MSNDFRSHLEHLEKNDKLLRVKKQVDPLFEIAAGIRKTSDIDGPALLFENIKGYPEWRVAGGVFATQKLFALALGLPLEATGPQITQRIFEFEEKCIKPKMVSTGPVKEIIIKGDDVDLGRLPIPTYSSKDAGPYLTAGVEIAKHPDTGKGIASIHRRMVLEKDRTTLRAGEQQHLGEAIVAAGVKGQALGVATVLGTHPAITVASQIKVPRGVDEIEVAGAMLGEPVELVKCETIDVDVPANAEVVIEGVVMPGEKANCGPFAEFPGNYITMTGSPGLFANVVKVTAITMRKEPVFHALLTGMPTTDNHNLTRWPVSAAAYRVASEVADVKAVNVTPGGTRYHYVVSLHKRSETEPRNIIYALRGARLWARHIIVVDDDIDVYNPTDVEWAVATRMLADRDILIIPGVNRGSGVPLDSGKGQAFGHQPMTVMSGSWSIDATMPMRDREWYQKAEVPGVENIDYL
jgi:UbiD family decarboxylase